MKRKLLTALSCTAALGLSVTGSWNLLPVNAAENDLIYGTVNVPYADFYYGELNKIEPQTEAVTGDYEAADAVAASNFQDEGMYDAVTSATVMKSTRFASSYFEETESGVSILGVSNVNVAISKALYEDVQQAMADGTQCQNPLVDFVSAMTVSEETPAEYKVINPDGTLSYTIGNTVAADEITASITSLSPWGNYQISLNGLEMESADALQGAIIETSDGAVYGLQHEDNLWLKPAEISFACVPFTEPHGNEVAYQRFADLPGKTITKITYLIANGDDIEISTNLFCNLLLSEEYGVTGDETVTYSAEGTKVSVQLTVPEDSAYTLTKVSFGREAKDISEVTYGDGVVTLPASFTPGTYTLSFEDEVYSGLQSSVLVDSGLAEDAVSFDGTMLKIDSDVLTGADYLASLSGVSINGEPVNGKGLASILFAEDGSLNLDAQTAEGENVVELFPAGGTYEVVLEAAGYPSVTFQVTH